MRAPRVLKASLFLAGVLLALLLVLPVRAPLSDEELARRVRASQPAWGKYDEDLKWGEGKASKLYLKATQLIQFIVYQVGKI